MFGDQRLHRGDQPAEGVILGADAPARQPVVRGGQRVGGTSLALTLSASRRVIDNAAGAGFLADLRALPEDTARAVA